MRGRKTPSSHHWCGKFAAPDDPNSSPSGSERREKSIWKLIPLMIPSPNSSGISSFQGCAVELTASRSRSWSDRTRARGRSSGGAARSEPARPADRGPASRRRCRPHREESGVRQTNHEGELEVADDEGPGPQRPPTSAGSRSYSTSCRARRSWPSEEDRSRTYRYDRARPYINSENRILTMAARLKPTFGPSE